MGSVDKDMLVEDVLLDSSEFAAVSENLFGNEQRDGVCVGSSFESEDNVDIVSFSQISNLSSDVFGGFSFA